MKRYKGMKRVEKFNFGVEVWSYPSTVLGGPNAGPQTSYEVYLNGERIQRFIFIDLGAQNKDLARAFAFGLATGVHQATKKPEKRVRKPTTKKPRRAR